MQWLFPIHLDDQMISIFLIPHSIQPAAQVFRLTGSGGFPAAVKSQFF